MRKLMRKLVNKNTIFVAAVLAVSFFLYHMTDSRPPGELNASARVVRIEDNTDVISGWRIIGGQEITARILSGPFKKQEIRVLNSLSGNLMLDRYVRVGDQAIFTLYIVNGKIQRADLVDYNRQKWHLIMFAIFAGGLILFARNTGIKALISFVFTALTMVQVGIPLILKGYDPLVVCLSASILFGVVTLVLVGGFSLRTLAASFGFTVSIVLSAGLTVFAGKGIRLSTAVSDKAITLFYSGYTHLDVEKIFWGAVILGASGAMVDIAISVATSVREVARANSALGVRKLILSGFEVGRAVLGTMTTTLLLAYVGCSLFLFLVFAAKTTHFARIVNFNFVSAEILRTLAGSIGMVMVAPLTACMAGLLYHRAYGIVRGSQLAVGTGEQPLTNYNGLVTKSYKERLFSIDTFFAAAVLVVSIGLFFLPGKNGAAGSLSAVGRITQIEDTTRLLGSVRVGKQVVSAKILSGPYRGKKIRVVNTLVGYALTDRYVRGGDRVLLMLDIDKGSIRNAKLVDYDRQNWYLFLIVVFAGLLIFFAGSIGIKAFVSFVFTISVMAKLLFPAILSGYDPLMVCLAFALLFGITTLLLVGGFSIRTLAAVIGFTCGIMISTGLALFVGQGMFLRGITCEWAVFLLQSGYPGLDLTKILLGSIVLGASGAMIDVAIAVATAVREVARANPALSAARLIRSGIEVGRAELGTMTTTLLLAYMGVNIFLVLLFAAKETPAARFLNISAVSHEIMRTLSGSFGMVLIAPITAIVAGWFYHRSLNALHGRPVKRLSDETKILG